MCPKGGGYRNAHHVSRAEVHADSHVQEPCGRVGRGHGVNPLPIAREAWSLLLKEPGLDHDGSVDPACQVENAQFLPAGDVGKAPAVR